ncbi:MAG: hypothetical protein K2X01_05495 [Cyanobacteria bacterium]|nr:hypothetical protein [Cyanobacteriota bacterium]
MPQTQKQRAPKFPKIGITLLSLALMALLGIAGYMIYLLYSPGSQTQGSTPQLQPLSGEGRTAREIQSIRLPSPKPYLAINTHTRFLLGMHQQLLGGDVMRFDDPSKSTPIWIISGFNTAMINQATRNDITPQTLETLGNSILQMTNHPRFESVHVEKIQQDTSDKDFRVHTQIFPATRVSALLQLTNKSNHRQETVSINGYWLRFISPSGSDTVIFSYATDKKQALKIKNHTLQVFLDQVEFLP